MSSLLIIFLLCTNFFASNIKINNVLGKTVNDINSKTIAVVGDNSAKEFEKKIGHNSFTYYLYSDSNDIYETENVTKTFMALENRNCNYVLLSLNSRTTLRNYDKDAFYMYMKNYMQIAKNEKKYLFVHTYMDTKNSNIASNKSTSKELDNILKNLSSEYANVFYIDMNNFKSSDYLLEDGKNYNAVFYETLCAKLMYLVDEINKVQYDKVSDWMKINDKSVLAVAGDSYAGTFARFEKDKKYNIQEFAKDGKTVEENSALINTAMDSKALYVLISTSVNDYEKQSPLYSFEVNLRKYINHALLNHKMVFLHTYMKYEAAIKRSIDINDYDKVIKKLATEYDNVIYIDMHKYEDEKYQMPDMRHYDKEFNDALYDEIDKWIVAFKN